MKAMINLKLLMLLHDKCARRVRYRMGATLESCSGKGVCSRPWDTPVLRQHASATYEVPVAR